MSLILRAQVARAAQNVVPSWPLESFIAVNPLAGLESHPFETAARPGVVLTRSRDLYRSDLERRRITDADLEAALLERIPELAGQLTIGATTFSALDVAVRDMKSAGWESPALAEHSIPRLDDYLSSWVSSYLSPDPLWVMPHKQHGLYRAWRTLARRDPSLPRAARRKLANFPREPDVALSFALDRLGVPAEAVTDTLREELTYLRGWVGHIKWRAEKIGDIDMISYLAVRFALRVILGIAVAPQSRGLSSVDDPALTLGQRADAVISLIPGARPRRDQLAAVRRVLVNHPVKDHPFTWQKAYELHYRRALLPALSQTNSVHERPEMQLVMCIDPRSEGMRRHLEHTAGIETFGFAGFFGIPVRFARFMARGAIDSLPALLTARHQITEEPINPVIARKNIRRARAQDALRQAAHSVDSSTTTPFAFAETTGWFYGAMSFMRTFTPTLHARLHRALLPSTQAHDTIVTIADAFSLDERAAMAETTVRMLGISQFAPLVVLAGHASESINNLYQSALDCGACGGNPGAANARAACAIFNDPEVRVILKTRGIDIPADSAFVAADHNTVTDAVTLLDRHLIPDSHREVSQLFDQRQRAAADQLVRERAIDLPGASPTQSLSRMRRRAHDWAEVYPELGLAGNAAMIIGPRQMTRGVDLKRRVFLHSYETELDPDGTGLETIMTAPLVVAQWINHQYYFSALNPTTLGAGTKTIHNAVGTIGVLAGHGGDLRCGLPWQSVGVGTRLLHEPLRLTVVVQAPLERVGDIVSRNQVLRNLLDNDWITLTARHDTTAAWHRYSQYGWQTAPTKMEGL